MFNSTCFYKEVNAIVQLRNGQEFHSDVVFALNEGSTQLGERGKRSKGSQGEREGQQSKRQGQRREQKLERESKNGLPCLLYACVFGICKVQNCTQASLLFA